MCNELKLYAIQNKDGLWFHRFTKSKWVKDFRLARIYSKIGPARAMCTFFATHHNDIPNIVCLHIEKFTIIDDTQRVQKNIKVRQIKKECRKLTERQRQIRELKQQSMEIQQKLNQLICTQQKN